MKITNWSIKRSGAALTIDGVNQETGRPIKLTGVVTVDRGQDNRTIAALSNGNLVELV